MASFPGSGSGSSFGTIGGVRIVKAGAERIDDLEPLWKALQQHHAETMPTRAGLEARDGEEAWQLRRLKYRSLLQDPQAFLLLAEDDDGQLVGYALVRFAEGSIGYVSGAQVGEIETLSVSPAARSHGIGGALMDAAERELAAAGITEVRLSVMEGNAAARRFYERRGMQPFAHVLLGPVRHQDHLE